MMIGDSCRRCFSNMFATVVQHSSDTCRTFLWKPTLLQETATHARTPSAYWSGSENSLMALQHFYHAFGSRIRIGRLPQLCSATCYCDTLIKTGKERFCLREHPAVVWCRLMSLFFVELDWRRVLKMICSENDTVDVWHGWKWRPTLDDGRSNA